MDTNSLRLYAECMAEIRIGTASWTDPGFIEDWYPPRLPPSERLRWYAEHFDMVEVNATFYALPAARTVERWCVDTPADFIFDVKLPKLLSRHAMQPRFFPSDLRSKLPLRNGKVELTRESEELVTRRLLQELEPLLAAKKLVAFLLQLPPGFQERRGYLGLSPGFACVQAVDFLGQMPIAFQISEFKLKANVARGPSREH